MTISTALLTAIIAVESNNNPRAGFPDGMAWGILQITKPLINDINRIQNHYHFIKEDALVPQLAEQMYEIYITHYATKARLGHTPTDEDVARIWRGGPNGFKDPKTVKYWKRVQTALQNEHSSTPTLALPPR